MSTTFGLFTIPIKTDEFGSITTDFSRSDYIEIAFRSRQINFLPPFDIVSSTMKDNVKVYPIDNSAQGIYTIGDIKREIAEQEVFNKIKQEIK